MERPVLFLPHPLKSNNFFYAGAENFRLNNSSNFSQEFQICVCHCCTLYCSKVIIKAEIFNFFYFNSNLGNHNLVMSLWYLPNDLNCIPLAYTSTLFSFGPHSSLRCFISDAVLHIVNMSQHFKFVSANLQFLNRHLREKPEMLLIGKDVADASHLVKNVTPWCVMLCLKCDALQMSEIFCWYLLFLAKKITVLALSDEVIIFSTFLCFFY